MRTLAAAVAVLAFLPGAASAAAPSSPATIKAVVHAWSARLNAGDNTGIARLFAVPAVVIQGQLAYRLTSRAQIAEWYSGLPCSGRIVSIAVHGRYATAVFRLGNRGSTKCDAPGGLAAARFEIVHGKIVTWQQVPVPTKDAAPGPVA